MQLREVMRWFGECEGEMPAMQHQVAVCAVLSVILASELGLAGETLYNGIVLPNAWPPKRTMAELRSGEVMKAPYLNQRPDARSVIACFLQQMNLKVETAKDGRMVCEMAEKSAVEGKPYDLILMDIQMPEMNGYEATRWLRQHGWQGAIVALTAYAMEGDREKCLAAGCDDYLSKPIAPQTLRAIVTRYIPVPSETVAAPRRVDPTDAPAIAPPPNMHTTDGEKR